MGISLVLFGCGGFYSDDPSTISLGYTLNGTEGPLRITMPTPIIPGTMRLSINGIEVGYDIDQGDGTGRLVDMDSMNTIIAPTSSVNYVGYTDALVISYTSGNAPPIGTILKISYLYRFL